MNPIHEELLTKGLKVGKNCYIDWNCVLDQSHCWLIEIGNEVTIAPQAIILAHDASTKRSLGATKVGQVIIKDGAFIGAGSIILPGVIIGRKAIVAAGAVVTKDVPDGKVVAGNPARVINDTNDYFKKEKAKLEKTKIIPKNSEGKIKKALYKKAYLKNRRGFQD